MQTYPLTLNLRVANRNDFADEHGNKKYGTVYCHLNEEGNAESELHKFTAKTNLKEFKTLYNREQILVPMTIFEFKDVINNP